MGFILFVLYTFGWIFTKDSNYAIALPLSLIVWLLELERRDIDDNDSED